MLRSILQRSETRVLYRLPNRRKFQNGRDRLQRAGRIYCANSGKHGLALALLHVGAHKTGTTALQNALRSSVTNAIVPEVSRGTTFDRLYASQQPSGLALSFTTQFEDDQGVYRMSEERLLGHPFNNGKGLYSGRAKLKEFVEDLQRQGIEVRLALTVRKHWPFLKSWYLQTLGAGTPEASLIDYMAARDIGRFNWSSLVDDLRSVAPLQVFCYEELKTQPDHFLVGFNNFFRTKAVRADQLLDRENQSVDAAGYSILQAISQMSDPKLRRKVATLVKKRFHNGKKPDLVPPLVEEAMSMLFAEEDKAFAASYLSPTQASRWIG